MDVFFSPLRYEHVFNNGNDGKGQVMETWFVHQSHHSAAFSFESTQQPQ